MHANLSLERTCDLIQGKLIMLKARELNVLSNTVVHVIVSF